MEAVREKVGVSPNEQEISQEKRDGFEFLLEDAGECT